MYPGLGWGRGWWWWGLWGPGLPGFQGTGEPRGLSLKAHISCGCELKHFSGGCLLGIGSVVAPSGCLHRLRVSNGTLALLDLAVLFVQVVNSLINIYSAFSLWYFWSMALPTHRKRPLL